MFFYAVLVKVKNFSWRVLYKLPLPKRSGDLQWRVLNGALATNMFLSKWIIMLGEGCVFCKVPEFVHHVFFQCHHWLCLLSLLSADYGKMGVTVSEGLYVLGPRSSAWTRHRALLMNFLFSQAKLAAWLTRCNRLQGSWLADPEFKWQFSARLRAGFKYYFFR